MKLLLIFVVVLMSVAVNLPEGMIARVGVDPNWVLAALLAWVIAAMIYQRPPALIGIVVLLSFGAHFPLDIGIDRDILAGTLVALVVVPYVASWLE